MKTVVLKITGRSELFCIDFSSSDAFMIPGEGEHLHNWIRDIKALIINGKKTVPWVAIWNMSEYDRFECENDYYCTLYSVPTFDRIITMKERIEIVDPARKFLLLAEPDIRKACMEDYYGIINSEQSE